MSRWLTLVLLLLSSLLSFARSGNNQDMVRFGSDVVVNENDTVGDIVVMGGHITVRGIVKGDIVVFAGEADIENRVAGDVVVMAGRLHLGPNASVGGDTVAFGRLDRDPNATLKGEVTEMRGPVFASMGIFGLFLILFFAFAPFILLIALIVYLFTRRRSRTAVVYPQGQYYPPGVSR